MGSLLGQDKVDIVDSWLLVVVQLSKNASAPIIIIMKFMFFLCFDQQQEEVLWISWGKTSVAYR